METLLGLGERSGAKIPVIKKGLELGARAGGALDASGEVRCY
jgi:hypothetical protein